MRLPKAECPMTRNYYQKKKKGFVRKSETCGSAKEASFFKRIDSSNKEC